MWTEKEIEISEIENLLDDYEIEVSSPDGWVTVSEYVDKGIWTEYLLTTSNGLSVRCNENHLFQTSDGWKYAKEMLSGKWSVYTKDGYISATVNRTNKNIPIVDIVVDHPNHRYYTNKISSHNTNTGKSLFLCDHAAKTIKQGKNALYITAEMAEERIAERIDCNLLGVDIDDLQKVGKKTFVSKIHELEEKTHGKLVIKEYPTSTAHAGHFRALLDELKSKKNFVPDVIYIDYINICVSQRLKGGSHNSYTIVKSIAEEFRAMAVEYNVPIWTATQTTRGGFNNSDVSMTDTSESFGLPATADFMFAMVRTEELDALGQIMIIQLKSRYGDVGYYRKFVIGVDIKKFTLYDVEESAQEDLVDSGSKDDKPVFDSSKFGDGMKAESFDFNFD